MGEEIGEHYPNARILIVGEPRAEVMKAIYGEANKISPDHITGLCLDKFNKGIYNLGANEEEVLTRILSIADCPHSLKQVVYISSIYIKYIYQVYIYIIYVDNDREGNRGRRIRITSN